MIELIDDLPRPIAYVLAGGASYGSVQVGQLLALSETDIRPDMILGTSVGSLNGAVIAENPVTGPGRLSLLWPAITRAQIFGTVLASAKNLAARRESSSGNEGLRSVIESVLNARTFEELAIPHTAVATDFETGEMVPITEGDLVSALLASAAIPVVFPPVERDGRKLVDGGLVANVPIGVAIAQGAETVVILDCGFTVLPPTRDNTLTGRLVRSAAIMAAQQVRRELQAAVGKTILYLPGPWPVPGRPDDFRRATEIATASFELSLEWLRSLHVDGPGKYGQSPSDALAARREVSP